MVVIDTRPTNCGPLRFAEQRGLASSIYSVGSLFRPVIGPICGGFIAQRTSWRWVFWVLLMASAAVTGGIIVMNRETNPTVLIKNKQNGFAKKSIGPSGAFIRNIYPTSSST